MMMGTRPKHVAQNIKTLRYTDVFDGTFFFLFSFFNFKIV
jgi:hypothetical protein